MDNWESIVQRCKEAADEIERLQRELNTALARAAFARDAAETSDEPIYNQPCGDVVVQCPRCEMRFLAPEDVIKRPAEKTSRDETKPCPVHGDEACLRWYLKGAHAHPSAPDALEWAERQLTDEESAACANGDVRLPTFHRVRALLTAETNARQRARVHQNCRTCTCKEPT